MDSVDLVWPEFAESHAEHAERAQAVMESFFSLLQKNVLNRQRWETRDELRVAIVTWIERTYHHRRRQRRLGRHPIEYETLLQAAHAA